jgi:lipopolysaccharide export LptBFGC system permease protein LptF
MEHNDGPKDANEPDKSTDSTQQLDAYIQDLKASQENLTWPGALRNNRGVDALFWKGNPKAPLVQRIGLILVAVALVLIGLSMVSLYVDQRSVFEAVFAAILFTVAGWFLRNAVRR